MEYDVTYNLQRHGGVILAIREEEKKKKKNLEGEKKYITWIIMITIIFGKLESAQMIFSPLITPFCYHIW